MTLFRDQSPSMFYLAQLGRSRVRTVTTLPMRDKLLECCDKRGGLWSSEVETRLHGCIDLVAAEAIYHDNCFSRFMLNKELGGTIATKTVQGRPTDQGMLQSFEKLCLWLDTEADAELYTLSELRTKMEEFSDQFGVYSIKRLKEKLQKHYKEFLFFAEIEG